MNSDSEKYGSWKHWFQSCIAQFLLIFALSFVGLYIISPGTSPSNPYVAADTSVFLTVGTALTDGFLPYRDYFDHKGPLLYYIYAIAQYEMLGKLGLFTLQTLAWSVSVFAVWKTFRLFISPKISVLLLFVFGVSVCGIGEGGLTEEWSLPISCLLLYIVLRHLRENESTGAMPCWVWGALGAGVAWHAMLRVTNAGSVCGEICALLLFLVYEKLWRKMLCAILFMLLGFLMVVFPVIIYYMSEDAGADLWYGLYEFNAKYAVLASGSMNYVKVLAKTVPAFVVILGASFLPRVSTISAKIRLLMISMALISIISLVPGYAFGHYFINYAPVLCCALIVTGRFVHPSSGATVVSRLLTGGGALALIAAPYVKGVVLSTVHGLICALMPGHPVADFNKYVTAQRFAGVIKESDSSRVLALNCMAEVYCYMRIRPCDKFFFLQNFLLASDPRIGDHMCSLLSGDDAPEWVIMEKGHEDEAQTIKARAGKFASIIQKRYTFVDCGSIREGRNEKTYALYRKK